MQNKANFLKDKINATFFATKDYENEPRLPAPGKQSQSFDWIRQAHHKSAQDRSKPISKEKNAVAKIEPAQSVVICFLLTPQPLSAIIKTVKTFQGIISLGIRRSHPEVKSLWVENCQINKLQYVFIGEVK